TSGYRMKWQQWVFHPLWSFAWADQEELIYLQQSQRQLDIMREGVRQHSMLQLQNKLAANRQSWRPPLAAWRFYLQLPMIDDFDVVMQRRTKYSSSDCPYADFTRAWSTTMKNLTLNDMVITAIAIKRYELQHGKPPPDLAALVPHFLAAVPRDLMDGQPL